LRHAVKQARRARRRNAPRDSGQDAANLPV